MKNKTRYFWLCITIISAFILEQCGPVTSVPIATETAPLQTPQMFQLQPEQVGPYLIGQNPPEGQRLELLPTLEFTFDREMDQTKTAQAFTLLDSNNKPVPGKKTWTDSKTFSFKPDSKLEPSTAYKATFSTSAVAKDGQALQQAFQLNLTTIDSLAVGQVFPVDGTEDIDPTTNITVIFNHPVVPLQIKEEQTDLPQPLIISPEVTGHGEWVNSSVYVFQPEKGLLSGTNYKVKVEVGLKDTNGDALDKSYTWNFSTRAPLIGNFALKNGQQNLPDTIDNVLLDQAFIVTFLQPMDEKSVRDAVTLVNRETGKPFPTKLTWDKELTTLTIEPIGRYTIASFYDLNIANTARASDGGRLRDGWYIKFGTVPLPKIVDIFPKPGSNALTSPTGKGFNADIAITFASPMRLDSLKNKIKITPQSKNELQWYFNDSNWQLQIFGLEPATEYVVRLLPGMSDIYGNTIKDEQSYSFTTGDYASYARLVLPWTPLVYRAKGPQEVYFEHLNLDSVKVSLYPLDQSDFNRMLLGTFDPTSFNPKVEPIREWTPDVNVPRNILNREKFKLQDAKENPLKPGYYFIGVQGKPLDYKSRFYQGSVFVVATDNITLKTSATDASVWVTDLESGKPQAGVSVTFYNDKLAAISKAVTDNNGLAHLDGLNNPSNAGISGADHFAFTSIGWGSGVWAGDFGLYEQYYSPPNSMFGYVYTDRPVYRPGQEVFFKGIVRQNDDLHYSLSKTSKVYLTIQQNGEQVFGDYMSLSDLGSFTGKLKLAEDAALGTYDVMLRQSVNGDPFSYLSFRVAEYHKPEFEVSASSDKGNVLAGTQVKFSLDAQYYSGGNLGNANTDWFIESAPYYFQPTSKYRQFNFIDWDRDIYWSPQENKGIQTIANGKGVTDAAGHFDVTQLLGENENKTSQQVTFSANVTDVSGNLVSGSTSMTVHQSEFYAGVRSMSYVGQQGKESPFEVVVLDWDSNPVPNQKVSVKFVERRWYSVQTQDKQGTLRWETSVKEIPVSTENAVTGDDGKVTVSFVPPAGGVYKAIVTVRDTKGHTQQSSAYTWVSSDSYVAWRQTNDRTFNLIADKDTYTPGDTAEILIAQPFDHDVYALVTYERGHVYKQDVILLKGNSTVYKLPITAEMAPISYISVTVISGTEQSGTPDFKIGMASIKVDTSHQTLDVEVSADKKSVGPGDKVTYTIATKDYSGKPVSADVSLAVVDKAALALAPMNSRPILDAFYSNQALSVQTALGLVSNADDFNAQYRESIPDGGGAGGGGGEEVSLGIITARQNFKDTAYFEGQVTTDKDGKAQVTVTLPENLTTWKADVRAVTADSKVGQTTQELLSTKPLFIEMQTPRFFIDGDQATVGATIHNNTDKAMSVNVSLDAKGVDLLSPAKQMVEVPAGQQKNVKWETAVQVGAKRVDFTASAVSGAYSDSSKPALGTLSDQGIPVYNYVATETVGTSGMLQNANSATEAIQLPKTFDFTDAKLSVEVSPSLAASMQNGLTYLDDYPYLCMEQTISRFLPNVITSRALKNAGIAATAVQSKLDAQVAAALQRIYAKQHYDGGWNWWDGDQSDPQTSAYVVYGLIEAQDSGYDISTSVLNNGLEYLTKHVPDLKRNDATWRYNRTAFMLYVLARADKLRASQVNFIFENRTSLSLYGKAYLAQAMYMLDKQDERVNSLLSDLEAASVLSAAGAHWEEADTDYWNWNTDTRTTAIVLNAFVQLDPKNPITANAVRWLMAHREKGHWTTTQETAWSLIALTNWMSAANEYDTDYAYAVGLNGNVLNQGSATKENLTQTVDLQVQLKDLLKDAANYLVFTRGDGTGNLYYTAYLSTELPVESIQPLDQGVSLARGYFTLDNSKKPITEATRGDLVRVRLTVVVPAAVHYIVVDDPLPAGFEAVDASILTDTAVPTSYTLKDYNERGWGWWYFSHVELRDEKVVLSADYLPAGTYVYTYLARASTAGTFKVIPPTASEFYFPDVGGRGAGSVFEVKP